MQQEQREHDSSSFAFARLIELKFVVCAVSSWIPVFVVCKLKLCFCDSGGFNSQHKSQYTHICDEMHVWEFMCRKQQFG
jgi:hypothetical protein